MNARTATAALALLAALTLTGCAGTGDTAGDERTAPTASESAAPLTAETTEPAPETESVDEQYLADVRKALTNGRETTIPDATDDQLLQAARDACSQAADGATETTVQVIEGEPFDADWGSYRDSATILTQAQKYYC